MNNRRKERDGVPRAVHKNLVRPAGIACALLILVSLTGCLGRTYREKIRKTCIQVELPDFGITLCLPREWRISFVRGGFYPVIAIGFGPHGSPVTVEYRGLKTQLRDRASKALFAAGWLQAPPSNYPTWRSVKKRQVPGDPEGAWEFEGTFKRNKTTYRRFGKLRFRGNRVHGIYYTTPNTSVRKIRKYFNALDSLHIYKAREIKEPGG